MGKLPSLKRFDVQKTILFLNAHFGHSPTGTTHRSHATLLSLHQENLGATQAPHLRGTNCRSPLPDGHDKIGEERSEVEMQLFLEGETLEDSGVVSWVDVQGFLAICLMPGSARERAVPPGGWTEHMAAAQWTVCCSQRYCWAGFSRPGLGRETGDCLLNLQSPEGIKRPESRQGMLAKNERAGRDSRQPG